MKVIFHIDANSAYLSWTAVHLLLQGHPVDLRTIPAVIAGDPENRHGIVLAKSISCKACGIATAQSLMEARQKCPDLVVYPPDYDLYVSCSDAMYSLLREYSSITERYSIDECFLDVTASHHIMEAADARVAAYELGWTIKERIKSELGFTVNVGIGYNRLTAKMASEFEKPDKLHTLWPEEVASKMWPLPVGELFMVGRATRQKLQAVNVKTIGDLANCDLHHLQALLKNVHGKLVWQYANGIDRTPVEDHDEIAQKGIGNSETIPYDITKFSDATLYLYALVERSCARLRKKQFLAGCVSVGLKTNDFHHFSHQHQLKAVTGSTREIYAVAVELLKEMWDQKTPIRQIGVRLSDLADSADNLQLSLFTDQISDSNLDHVVDQIRERWGTKAIVRGRFCNSAVPPMLGGTNDGNYISLGGRRE